MKACYIFLFKQYFKHFPGNTKKMYKNEDRTQSIKTETETEQL